VPPRADAFLGTGWAFPPEFNAATGSVRMVSGVADVDESLFILLSTDPGERVMLPTYGCDLRRFLFRPLTTALIEEIRDTVATAIDLWEKRIDLLACDVRQDEEEPGLVRIELSYLVRRSNRKGNFVFPLYLDDRTVAERP
jgi:hypothetical protein